MSFLNSIDAVSDYDAIRDGVAALVRSYYREYTDATEIDGSDMRTFRDIDTLVNSVSANVFSVDTVIAEVEAELRAQGRIVQTDKDDDL